jgi:hypothetical protein
MIGRVTGSEIKKNRDGDKKVVLLQVEITDPDDMQTVELMNNAGVNSNPPNDSNVFIVQAGKAFKVAVAVDDGIEPDAEKGEYEIYSSDGGIKKASAYCKKDGTLVLNLGADFAVRFTSLKTGFDNLVSDFNANVAKYNAHTHGGAVAAPVGPELMAQSTANVDAAKITDIMVP